MIINLYLCDIILIMARYKYQKEIMEICKNNHLHIRQIWHLLQTKKPSLGQATVYRTVKYLCAEGKMRKVDGVSESSLYETNDQCHGHVVEDSKVSDFVLKKDLISILEKQVGKKIKDIDLKIFI